MGFYTGNGGLIGPGQILLPQGIFDLNVSLLFGEPLFVAPTLNAQVRSIAIQSDGKILAGGDFTLVDSVTKKGVTRLTSGGTVETAFNAGTGFNNVGHIYAILVRSDNKIVLGGSFNDYEGTTQTNIILLNSDGTRDTSGFNVGNQASGTVRAIAGQSDGKIIIGGGFANYNGVSVNFIARLNADGTRDTGFITGSGFDQQVFALAVQSDGKILVGGSFSSYNGTSRNRIIRLNADGSVDTGFSIGTGVNGTVRSIAIQSNGQILLGGGFITYNGVTQNRITRINADGTRDVSFDIGIGFNADVYSLAVQPDGKILAGGLFDNYSTNNRNFIARLNANGTIDTTFNIGTGFNDLVLSVAVQPNGKILVGGNFTSYNGTTQNRITRLNANGVIA